MSADASPPDPPFPLPSDSKAVTTEAFRRYATRLVAVARGYIRDRLRQKVDAEDVVQSVFRSFYHHHASGQFEVTSWESLWGLLVCITMRKCGRKVAYYQAACRDARREASSSRSDSETMPGIEVPS